MAGIKNSRQLTHRQERALQALIAYPSVREASRAVEIPERTLYRWVRQRDFRALLEEAEGDPQGVNRARRRFLADDALDVLHRVMSDAEAPVTVRVEAARTFLEHLHPGE
jgi:transposase-like protein